jgi:hypothetical protein
MGAIFGVTDALGISREAVTVPLRPASPGGVRRLPGEVFEITVDSDLSFSVWVGGLETQLRTLLNDRPDR